MARCPVWVDSGPGDASGEAWPVLPNRRCTVSPASHPVPSKGFVTVTPFALSTACCSDGDPGQQKGQGTSSRSACWALLLGIV